MSFTQQEINQARNDFVDWAAAQSAIPRGRIQSIVVRWDNFSYTKFDTPTEFAAAFAVGQAFTEAEILEILQTLLGQYKQTVDALGHIINHEPG